MLVTFKKTKIKYIYVYYPTYICVFTVAFQWIFSTTFWYYVYVLRGHQSQLDAQNRFAFPANVHMTYPESESRKWKCTKSSDNFNLCKNDHLMVVWCAIDSIYSS